MKYRTKINEAMAKRARAVEAMRAVIDAADAEDRNLTAEDEQACDAAEADIAAADVEIRRFELLSSTEVEGRSLAGASSSAAEERRVLTLQEWRAEQAPRHVQDDPAYVEAFYRLLTVRDPRELGPDELRALSKATASAGANLVPTEFQRTLIDALRWFGSFRSLATTITTTGGETLETPSVTTHGTAAWTAENAAYTESDEAFGKVSLSAFKAATIMKVSEELLADAAFDLDGYIRAEFANRIGVLEETAYVVGDGSGKPTGVVTSATAGVTAAAVAAITGDEMIDLYYALAPQYRNRATYLVADGAEKLLRKLKDSAGQYLWAAGLVAGQPNTFNGRPIVAHPDMAAPAASTVPVLFGDFSWYWIRDVNGIAFQRLVELYAANGQVGFRAYHRTDGKLINTAAVKKLTMAAS